MIFQEYMHKHNKLDVNVKIFATDVDEDALAIATQGLYPTSSLKDVSLERRENFFISEGHPLPDISIVAEVGSFRQTRHHQGCSLQ